jgi:hypothetical protein
MPVVIVSFPDRVYKCGDTPPVRVNKDEDDVLQAFIGDPVRTTADLIADTGDLDAARVLVRLKTKYQGRFAPGIITPGRKGGGSYVARVVDDGGSPV